MGKAELVAKTFDTKKSVRRAAKSSQGEKKWMLQANGKKYAWANSMERVPIIRAGVPYSAIDEISNRLHSPIKAVLPLLGLAQTTYNKKKAEKALLDPRSSELILMLTEVLDFGAEVFNHENEKFLRWLKKPNISLGGHTPGSMLDTTTGIQEVLNCLNRIEYGNLA